MIGFALGVLVGVSAVVFVLWLLFRDFQVWNG